MNTKEHNDKMIKTFSEEALRVNEIMGDFFERHHFMYGQSNYNGSLFRNEKFQFYFMYEQKYSNRYFTDLLIIFSLEEDAFKVNLKDIVNCFCDKLFKDIIEDLEAKDLYGLRAIKQLLDQYLLDFFDNYNSEKLLKVREYIKQKYPRY
jgi:hypothetical protein